MKHTSLVLRLASKLSMMPGHVELIVNTAPLRYKKFEIPKRDGAMREVAQPAREVKAIQRLLVEELADILPIHSAVAAYEKGMSIKKNAERHLDSKYLLKMDLKKFFPSITGIDVAFHINKYDRNSCYSQDELRQIVSLCCWRPSRGEGLRLCIGAPSSPLLSNSILYEFDALVANKADSDGVTYSRYADDLTFSSVVRGILSHYPKFIEYTLASIESPKLTVNKKKTVHCSRAGLRMVTGVVLTDQGTLSVGRERKKLVRAMFHRKMIGQLSEEELAHLNGLLAFIDGIEPGFSEKLIARYQ